MSGHPVPAPSRRAAIPPAGWAAAGLGVIAFTLAFWAFGRVDPHYYYTAAVRSMSSDWHDFLYGAYDPAGSVTVDKVPGALWFQALFVRALGFHDWVVLLPQALAFAATVPVLFLTVRQWIGDAGAVVAAAVLTFTPVAVATARVNIPDTFLVLFLVCAAHAVLTAIRSGRRRHLIAAALWVGVAFQMKMAQAFVVLPAFALAYGVAAGGSRTLRIRRAAAAGGVVVAVSSLWLLLLALTPRAHRPYIDGSGHDSAWEMAFQYNGLSRFGHGTPTASQVTSFLADFGGRPGAGRLFGTELGLQISWLLPFAALALVLGIVLRRGRPRTDLVRAGWLLWGGWLLLHAVAFSAASAIHPYYTVALAPAIAALCGAGSVVLVRAWRRREAAGRVLPCALALTGGWAVVLLHRAEAPVAWTALVGLVTVALCVVLVLAMTGRSPLGASRRGVGVALALTAGSLVLAPGVCAVGASAKPFDGLTGLNPTAGPVTALPAAAMASLHGMPPGTELPPGMGNMNMTAPDAPLLAYVDRHHRGERYRLAVPTANTAAPYVAAGRSTLPMGGFTGSAPVPTTSELAALTASGDLRYVMVGGFHGGMGGPLSRERQEWVAAHCAPVPPARYRGTSGPSGPPQAPETLFDCAPTAARAAP